MPLILIFILYQLVGWGLFGNIPSQTSIQNISKPIASELYTSNDKLIGRYYIENRSQLYKEDINNLYKNALIATEDHRFYNHNGVDYKSLFRVFIKTILLQRDASGGGSTITQQLAKNLFPRTQYKIFSTVINKFREMHIAKRLERIYSKDEILWMYSSTVSFGERAFGLASASKRFFNKDPKNLLLEEAATLVGLLKATSYYSPRRYPQRALNRRNVVLSQMVKHGYLDTNAFNSLKNTPLTLDYQSENDQLGLAQYFQQYVKKEFNAISKEIRKEDGSKYNIYYDGLKIYTSLDYDLQVTAEKIVKTNMQNLQKIFESSWKGGSMYGRNNKIIDDKILNDPIYKKIRQNGANSKAALKIYNKEIEDSFWTWEGEQQRKVTRIDSIKHYLKLLHTGLLAADPKSGKIKVWIGGNDFKKFQYDNVTEARQVGSLFKPIVYLTALENGKTACDLYKNELKTYAEYDDWTPKNSSDEYGGYMSMKAALTHSVNTVSVQVLFDAGLNNVVNTAESLGIKSKLSKVPSIVLGTSDISLFEMVQAYANIANYGKGLALSAITKVEDKYGNIIYTSNDTISDKESLFEQENIRNLRAMMTSVTREGTGSRLYGQFDVPFPVFGKTGTTQKQSDGWFIGGTDDLIIGSWVGTKDRRMHFRSIGTGSGGRTALPMVGALFEYAGQKGHVNYTFQQPVQFNCPDYLDEEQYAYFQKNKDIFEKKDTVIEKPRYGGWLGKLLAKENRKKRRGTLKDQYNERRIKEELANLKRERDKRMQEYEAEMKAWERKLEELNKD